MPNFLDISRRRERERDELSPGLFGRHRKQAMQRLQVGLVGVVLMILLVGLAGIVKERAAITDATAVAPAQAVPGAEVSPTTPNDALVEAGVVPDLPAVKDETPAATPVATPQTAPSAGGAAPDAAD